MASADGAAGVGGSGGGAAGGVAGAEGASPAVVVDSCFITGESFCGIAAACAVDDERVMTPPGGTGFVGAAGELFGDTGGTADAVGAPMVVVLSDRGRERSRHAAVAIVAVNRKTALLPSCLRMTPTGATAVSDRHGSWPMPGKPGASAVAAMQSRPEQGTIGDSPDSRMRDMRCLDLASVCFITFAPLAVAQQTAPPTVTQTQADDYTRYELLAPASARFRILYEVTATTPGSTQFFNPIRKGSVASDEHVYDRMTGAPLSFDVVGGDVARAGGVRNADSSSQYIRVRLARPVPPDGEARILIDKTYSDPKSYFEENGLLVFSRPLGIKRNAVVLPAGYEVVSCSVPSQIIEEADGRLSVSFWNAMPGEAPLVVKARRLARPATPKARTSVALASRTTATTARSPTVRLPLDERAHQNREIVYFLQQPETHAFDLYHDYTESRPGVDKYLNVVRAGSTVAHPSARILDTGEELKWEVVTGDAIRRAGLDVPDVTPQTQVVVFHFAPVKPNGSVRLRMYETYTDSARYRLDGDMLVWDRSFGRPANAVVLPAGWDATNSAIPATISETADGRVRLDFINPRPDEIDVFLTARRRERARP